MIFLSGSCVFFRICDREVPYYCCLFLDLSMSGLPNTFEWPIVGCRYFQLLNPLDELTPLHYIMTFFVSCYSFDIVIIFSDERKISWPAQKNNYQDRFLNHYHSLYFKSNEFVLPLPSFQQWLVNE